MIRALKEIGHDFANSFWQHYIIWAFVLTAMVSGLNMELFWLYRHDFFYTDTDCWMRAVRITDWLQNFQWSEKIFPWTNPPYGFVLHWTRACDVIWALLSLPFLLFLPIKEAVFYGGMLFSPLFLALSTASVAWGIKPYISDKKHQKKIFAVAVLLVLFYLNKIDDIFDFHRPDHHSLMCFVFCFNIAAVLRSHFIEKHTEILSAGIITGLGMWASSTVEGFFVAGLVLITLATDWIFYNRSAKLLLYYTAGFFGSTFFAWLINPPFGGWGVVDINRLSSVHVVLTFMMFISFAVINALSLTGKYKKISLLGLCAVLSAGLLPLVFGLDKILVPIYHPLVWQHFIPRIGEMGKITFSTEPFIVYSLICGGLLLALLAHYLGWKKSSVIYLTVFFCGTVIACLFLANRFYPYYLGVFVFIIALILNRLLLKAETQVLYKWLSLFYIACPILYLATSSKISADSIFPPVEGVVLSDLFKTPELLFRQGVDCVGSPYHTNVEGIVANHTMWFTTDEKELKLLLKQYNVRTLYLPFQSLSKFYIDPYYNLDKLYGKVMTGKEIYPWMEKIAEGYYVVNYDKF